jgi:hypothetical protein
MRLDPNRSLLIQSVFMDISEVRYDGSREEARAETLVGRRVSARVHGPMDIHPVVGVMYGWDWDVLGRIVVYVTDEQTNAQDAAWLADVELA